ncbi:MAG: DUF445 family protein [Leptotrichiaceae bacterium]|nr:DUF445 family protein [Leptotrichiaceae bacterium]MBP6281798.1 DUF445 family protein [Leptotrichiaceae bacterium]MBP7100989.1 DUF445 family protein [Leptotrichiaceae bacterium]MBP7725580.1 DUF445 family protein [Leptotrichiaceae bacterium]MBP9630071.1 DUF445 family protein [Leptotrichiaceae bacterium]
MNKLVLQFFLIVSVGALIGWFTNYLAIKLLFRPYKEIRLLFFKIQGLIPKRKDEIVENIAEVVEKELISISDITEKMQNEKIDESVIDGLLDKIVGEKLQKKILEKNPLLKMFVNDSMIDKMKSYFKKTILENKEEIVAEIVKIAEEKINIREIMIEKMHNFSLEEMERIILTVSKNELKHIEIIGGILGGTIAIFQFLLMLLLNKIK